MITIDDDKRSFNGTKSGDSQYERDMYELNHKLRILDQRTKIITLIGIVIDIMLVILIMSIDAKCM